MNPRPAVSQDTGSATDGDHFTLQRSQCGYRAWGNICNTHAT